MSEFNEVYHHRMRYFLTPQFDMYRNARAYLDEKLSRGPNYQPCICDYGCGNGVGSVMLSKTDGKWRVSGIDSDDEAIAFAKDAWGHMVHFDRGDWDDTTFFRRLDIDAIVCLEVIEHVKRPEVLLQSFKKTLGGSGHLILSTLNHNSQYRKNRGHIGKFCLEDFQELVSQYFPGVRFYDYTLKNELEPGSSITPMVAVWSGM